MAVADLENCAGTVASGLCGKGGTLYPPSSGLVPLVPPSQRCGLCQYFKQTTLTTRLYKVRTNLYPPLTKTFRRACAGRGVLEGVPPVGCIVGQKLCPMRPHCPQNTPGTRNRPSLQLCFSGMPSIPVSIPKCPQNRRKGDSTKQADDTNGISQRFLSLDLLFNYVRKILFWLSYRGGGERLPHRPLPLYVDPLLMCVVYVHHEAEKKQPIFFCVHLFST